MQDFLPIIASSLHVGQRQILQRFLDDAANGRVTASPDTISAALAIVGSLLDLPAVDLTDPNGYNTTLATLQANIAGLMQEVDLLESVQDALSDLNNTELDKTETALRSLQTMLDATRAANAANIQYTDVFFETFGNGVRQETDPSWYTPIPVLAASGQVNSYLPLFIDPDDNTLKLFPGGDFSRTTNSRGERLAHIEVEEMLGLSSDPTHPIIQAVDGSVQTYWAESILSDQPIYADPLQVPWLPDAYAGGAAARLHFRFPFAVPFSEVVLRPFSKFPVHALQVVWANRNIAATSLLPDEFFASGTTFWTTGGVGKVSFPTAGGSDNQSYAQVQAVSGRTTLASKTFAISDSTFAYHFVFRINRQASIRPRLLVEWFDLNQQLVRADWHVPTTPVNQWFEADKLFNAPSGITSGWTGQVTLVADGSGSCQLTRVTFTPLPIVTNSLLLDQQQDLGSDALVIQLDNAAGTDVWLVLAQPHYEYLQLTIPQGELDKQDIWNDIQLQVSAAAANLISTSPTLFSTQAGQKNLPMPVVQNNGTTLVKEVMRLGGQVRDLVVNLQRLAAPDPTPVVANRYLYVLGAWEIEIRHREYAPAGLFVSKPFQPNGEVRQLLMITQPDLSHLDRRVRFWITARAGDRTDKAQLFGGRCTFSSSTESVSKRADTHFTLTPVTIKDQFNGTDRQRRIALTNYPYSDRDRIWTLQTRLTSGFTDSPLTYDPNKDPVFFLTSNGIASMTGYRPLRVSLAFADGTVAHPDLLGKIEAGDISYQNAELLSAATISQEYSFLTQNTQKVIDAKVEAARPSDRAELRSRLVQDALQSQQLGAGQSTSKKTQTVQLTALQTKYKKIITGVNGAVFSLYWHKSNDIAATNGALSVITSGDVLVSPAKYTVDAQNGLVIVRDTQPNGNPQYDSFVAYYYYQQDEIGARNAQDARSLLTRPTSGVDFIGSLPQTSLVTRNVTDYVHGSVSSMRQANTDDLDPDFYPVYEYLMDQNGRLVFANDLSVFGDTPAAVTVEYESLLIAPRIIIEYVQKDINEFSTKSPVLNGYSLHMQARS